MGNIIDLSNEKEKARTFSKYETYVFIRTKDNSLYNGYIISVSEKEFVFRDSGYSSDFPIPFSSLSAPIVPSKYSEVRK